MKNKLSYLFIAFLLALPSIAAAQKKQGGLGEAADRAGLEKGSIQDAIAIIVNVVLSFLGSLFTILIILGGFRWMTAGGNQENVAAARRLIRNSVVGLAIVLVSYAFSRFVLASFQDANAGGGSVTTGS